MSTETVGSGRLAGQGNAPQQALKDNLREYGLVLALIAIMLFFQFMTDGVLFKPVNLTNLVLQNSYIIIMALGMLLVIVGGPHRPVGRLGRGLHRRGRRGADGQLRPQPASRRRSSAFWSAP